MRAALTHPAQSLSKQVSGSRSGFSQIFDSGSGSVRKTQSPAGVDSGTADPWRFMVCPHHWNGGGDRGIARINRNLKTPGCTRKAFVATLREYWWKQTPRQCTNNLYPTNVLTFPWK